MTTLGLLVFSLYLAFSKHGQIKLGAVLLVMVDCLGILQSLIALVLLISGGLNGLQTASIVAALPFAVIMLGMCVSLLKALKGEEKERKRKERQTRQFIERLKAKEQIDSSPSKG